MALLLALSSFCGVFILLTAAYSPFLIPALVCLLALLACSLRLLRRSRRDPLTELGNRYLLDSRKKRYKRKADLWVLYIDLDHLKQVNDIQGHAAGDQLLRDTARFLQSASGKLGDAYRIGGDEFLLVFSSGSPDDFLSRWQTAKVPASWGAARGPGEAFDGLVAVAEQAMYAKRSRA